MAKYKVVDVEKLDADLSSVANTIRTKGGTTESLPFPQGFVDAVGAIKTGGGTEEIEQIIDQSGVLGTTDETATEKVEQLIEKATEREMLYTALQNGTKFDYRTLNFGSTNYQYPTVPKMDFSNVTDAPYLFASPFIEYIDYYINSPKCYNFSSFLYNTQKLKWIVGIDLSSAEIINDLTVNTSIETIHEPLNLSNVTKARNAFHGVKLKDIRFVPESIKISITILSPVLSIGNVFNLNDTENVGSVQSIINGLVTLAEGATAQTLTLSKNLPLTEEQKQAITTAVNNKGWTLAFA